MSQKNERELAARHRINALLRYPLLPEKANAKFEDFLAELPDKLFELGPAWRAEYKKDLRLNKEVIEISGPLFRYPEDVEIIIHVHRIKNRFWVTHQTEVVA